MTHLNELYLILNKYLKWNKSHLKCFALIMLVIILKQTCNLSSASKALPIKCLPQSFYRRMQRFFAGQYFDYRQISQLIFNMFSFDQVQLSLDRTNWKWGKRNINILMLAIVYRGIAIPILSVHDKFHRTLILSGFCLLKIAKISLNSSFFPKPIKR